MKPKISYNQIVLAYASLSLYLTCKDMVHSLNLLQQFFEANSQPKLQAFKAFFHYLKVIFWNFCQVRGILSNIKNWAKKYFFKAFLFLLSLVAEEYVSFLEFLRHHGVVIKRNVDNAWIVGLAQSDWSNQLEFFYWTALLCEGTWVSSLSI